MNTGQFPQVGGLAFSYDVSQPAGARVRSLVITDSNGNPTDVVAQNGGVVGDEGRTFRIVPTTVSRFRWMGVSSGIHYTTKLRSSYMYNF